MKHGVVINHVPRPEENIRRAGEDIAVGAEILKPGIKLRPQDIAQAASAGLPELPVYRRVRVGVFFTGDELVQPGEPLPPGAIYNSNRYALRALLEGMGCEVRDLGTVPDNLDATRDALRRAAADNDLIVTSGGVSVGEEDHVKPAVEAEGRARHVEDRHQAGQAAGLRRSAQAPMARPGSSACRATRCRLSSPS